MSQLTKRLKHGYDASGETPFTLNDKRLTAGALTQNAGGQSINFKTLYFPTGTNFSLASVPTGMSLNASSGLLNGTPTALQTVATKLTVTYTSPGGACTKVVDWNYKVSA